MPKNRDTKEVFYTPDGEKVTRHEHHWVQVDMTVHPNPSSTVRPIRGATVLWRCTRRGCGGYRTQVYDFRRPRSNQQVNALRRGIDVINLEGEVTG
mgnify:CR=1 FL=1